MKKVLKWTAIVIGGLLALVLILAGGLYLFAPDPVTARSEAEIAASPEAVFAQFADYDYWYELWDVVDVTASQETQGEGSTFQFVEPDGTVLNGTITQYEEGRVYAASFDMEGIDAEFAFALTLEPTANGTHAVLYNEGSVGGPMKVMMAAYALTGELDAYYDLVINRLKTKMES
jgi:uncharacterized protein YndB with AHSA1/START domain